MSYIWFILLGYLSGSVMYAYILPKLICKKNVMELSEDGNPGAANAFSQAGVLVGILVLICELGKGFLPVYFAGKALDITNVWFAAVMAAPVFGHAFPISLRGNGGKAIAVSFGVLIGLFPTKEPLILLALFYLLFSLIFIVRPHIFRSILTFLLFAVSCFFVLENRALVIGCVIISAIVIVKHIERYQGEKFEIHFGLRRRLERG